jgi:hypothetical protein
MYIYFQLHILIKGKPSLDFQPKLLSSFDAAPTSPLKKIKKNAKPLFMISFNKILHSCHCDESCAVEAGSGAGAAIRYVADSPPPFGPGML